MFFVKEAKAWKQINFLVLMPYAVMVSQNPKYVYVCDCAT